MADEHLVIPLSTATSPEEKAEQDRWLAASFRETTFHVIAWDSFDENGDPIFAVNKTMTHAEYDRDVAGRYAWNSIGLTRPISREAIDRAMREGR